MKRFVNISFLLLIATLCVFFSACGDADSQKNLWETATYTEDTELGTGAKTVKLEVKAGEKSVTFTIKTDKEILGEALVDNEIISGEKGAYGLYVKVANGITADYDEDKSYWAITQNGESVMTGVDGIKFSDGEHYELVYTR
ncbi:MAG: DUF4430 domain-containing protein [Clostridia bacterium]|nr:DUF4430 domain-containing protein [Clostridia bacterium]